jgi:hypothetical protein
MKELLTLFDGLVGFFNVGGLKMIAMSNIYNNCKKAFSRVLEKAFFIPKRRNRQTLVYVFNGFLWVLIRIMNLKTI